MDEFLARLSDADRQRFEQAVEAELHERDSLSDFDLAVIARRCGLIFRPEPEAKAS